MIGKMMMSAIAGVAIVVSFVPVKANAEGVERDCGRLEFHIEQGESNILDLEDVNRDSRGLACNVVNTFDNKLKSLGKTLLSKTAYVDLVKQHVAAYDRKTNNTDLAGSKVLTRYLNRWVTCNYNKVSKSLVSSGTPNFMPKDSVSSGTPNFMPTSQDSVSSGTPNFMPNHDSVSSGTPNF